MLLFLFCSVLSKTLAKFTVGLQMQAHVPITVALPSAAPPLMVSSSIPLSLSLSPCPLSAFPTSVVSHPSLFSVLLDAKGLKSIADRGRCPNGTDTSLFATITSDKEANGALFMMAIDRPSSHLKSIEVDGSTYFSVSKGQYVTHFFQLHLIEQGVNLEIGLSHGSVEIFVSFCVDIEGKPFGKAEFPLGFSKFIDSAELVQLMESYSCDGGALYHDLENHPPELIVRVKSADAIGGIIVSADEHHPYGPRVHRAASSGEPVTLRDNDTVTLDFPVREDVSFSVMSGRVSVSGLLCAEEAMVILGSFGPGNHTIAKQLLTTDCNVTMTKIALIWLAEEDTIMAVAGERHPERARQISWYVLAIILVVSAAAVSVIIGGIFYLIERASVARKKEEQRSNNIPMTTMMAIPLDDRWK